MVSRMEQKPEYGHLEYGYPEVRGWDCDTQRGKPNGNHTGAVGPADVRPVILPAASAGEGEKSHSVPQLADRAWP